MSIGPTPPWAAGRRTRFTFTAFLPTGGRDWNRSLGGRVARRDVASRARACRASDSRPIDIDHTSTKESLDEYTVCGKYLWRER